MKIIANKEPFDTKVYTESGEEIKNLTEIRYRQTVNGAEAELTVCKMKDSVFETLNKDCRIHIVSDSLMGYPTYEIIEHLKEMGYDVTPKT